MAGSLINITDAGRAALVAPGNAGTNAHKIVEIGLSTAVFDATDRTLKKLPNELKRIATFAGENVAFDTIHVTLRDDTSDQYKLYGLGLYLENGVLFGVYCQNAADGPIMEKSPAALLLLSADMQFTTIDATKLVFGDASFTNPPATTERQGVVELATQAEVNAGTDDLRAITPKTAAARYAALTGALFSGQVILAEGSLTAPGLTFDKDGAPDTGLYHIADGSFGVTCNGQSVLRFTMGGVIFDKTIQVAADIETTNGKFQSTRYGDTGAIRMRGANGTGAAPTATPANTKVATVIGSGYDGAKFQDIATIDVWSEGAIAGDTTAAGNIRMYTKPAGSASPQERLRITAAGRSLFGTMTDDGTNLVQIGGNASTRGVHTFGYGATVAWASTDTTAAYFRSNGHVSVGSEATAGFLDLVAGSAARARVLPSGRVLIGLPATDDGVNTLQVKGPVKGSNDVGSLVASNGGGTGQTSIMLTREGAATDEKRWEIMHASTGAFSIRSINDAYSAGRSVMEIVRPTGGGVTATLMKLMLDGGRVLVGTSTDDGYSRLQVAGNISVNRAAGEGQLALGGNDGYFYGNAAQCGWYSPTKGAFRYDFVTQNLFVGSGNNPVWHAGNLTPLDLKKDGTMYGDLYFSASKRIILAEGSAVYPSLTFANDGAPDTGLYHINDGTFAVTCNAVTTVRFTPSITAFDRPVTGPTPAAGDVSTLLATTEWVTAKIAAAAIGQIVMEPRTSARAGYLKVNGALVNRADYPALWAYAQASGALVTEAQWSAGRWGCFSSGDGATTFRIPELRGESIRCWDDGRGVDGFREIGSWQDSQNRSHAHGASAGAVGDHAHSAWTDTQGWHGHTYNDGGHAHGIGNGGSPGGDTSTVAGPGANRARVTSTDGAGINISINGDGNHTHGIGMNGAGAHSHAITVNADGGAETRVRNVALLAMIRAY
ncbi:phage tail protein [Paraburkholderia metrosideri]|uniref:Phage tail protein n=1 Tax=Paraburkholderia metrosideri TaxID=580937 RepID=A0ABW9E7K2_9BURK